MLTNEPTFTDSRCRGSRHLKNFAVKDGHNKSQTVLFTVYVLLVQPVIVPQRMADKQEQRQNG